MCFEICFPPLPFQECLVVKTFHWIRIAFTKNQPALGKIVIEDLMYALEQQKLRTPRNIYGNISFLEVLLRCCVRETNKIIFPEVFPSRLGQNLRAEMVYFRSRATYPGLGRLTKFFLLCCLCFYSFCVDFLCFWLFFVRHIVQVHYAHIEIVVAFLIQKLQKIQYFRDQNC